MNTVQKAMAWLDAGTFDADDLLSAEAIITALLAEREAFVALLQDMLESDLLMGRVTDTQIQKAIQLCEESK